MLFSSRVWHVKNDAWNSTYSFQGVYFESKGACTKKIHPQRKLQAFSRSCNDCVPFFEVNDQPLCLMMLIHWGYSCSNAYVWLRSTHCGFVLYHFNPLLAVANLIHSPRKKKHDTIEKQPVLPFYSLPALSTNAVRVMFRGRLCETARSQARERERVNC